MTTLRTTPPACEPATDHTVPFEVRRHLARLTGDEKHRPAAHSTLDVLWVLYDRVLDVDPNDPAAPHRDRFLMSKGHGPAAYYAVLAAKGFIAPEALDRFAAFDSTLGHHPDRLLVPGVEISSGSLGHGLPIGVGVALALRALGNPARVFVLVGDGELDEGSNYEAIAVAGRLGIDGLTVIAVDNRSSSLGWPGGLEQRFAVEGWDVRRVPGHHHDAVEAALAERAPRPSVVVVEARLR